MSGIEFHGFGFVAKAPMSHALTYGRIQEDALFFQRPLRVVYSAVTDFGYLFVFKNPYAPTELGVALMHLEGFYQFMHSVPSDGMTREKLLSMKNEELPYVDARFQGWIAHQYEQQFLPLISAGNMTFEQAYAVCPLLKNRPQFQKIVEQCRTSGSVPKAKRGKRLIARPAIKSLYDYACRCYVDSPGLNLDDAYHQAVVDYPDLVPDTWRMDPAGTLKRYAHRWFDKTKDSQLTYRQSRKKA